MSIGSTSVSLISTIIKKHNSYGSQNSWEGIFPIMWHRLTIEKPEMTNQFWETLSRD